MERRGRKERFRAGVGKLREKREGNEKIAVGSNEWNNKIF